MPAPLIFLLFLVLVPVLLYVAWLQAKRRREAMAALAGELGWRFNPSNDRGHDDEYGHFEIFRKGSSRIAYNTLRGTHVIDGREFDVKMGDFRYTVSDGENSHTYRGSYMILHLPFFTPNLLIRREGVFDKLKGALGFGDINFESDAFSRSFHVSSNDRKFAYDVVHPRMMEWLMAKEVPAIEIENSRCLLVDPRSTWEPQEFQRWLRRVEEFFGQWPGYLLGDLEADGARARRAGGR